MGQEILYCVTCQSQLRSADFGKGRAFKIDGQPYCLQCSREVVKAFPPERVATILNQDGPLSTATKENISEKKGSRTTQILRIVGTPKSTRRGFRAASPQNLLLALGGGAALVLVLVGVVAVSRSTPSVSRSGSSEESRPLVIGPASSSPVPPPAIRPSSEARREPEVPRKEDRSPELVRLDEDLRRAFLREEFGHALRLIENARSQNSAPEWLRMLNEKTIDVHSRADETFLVLKAKAVAAKLAGDLEEPRKIKERLSKWEIARVLPELEVALAGVAIPSPAPAIPEVKVSKEAPEATLFRSQWEKAFELARARDFTEAVALLERGMTSLRDEKLRAEAAADLEGLRKAAALYAESLQVLSKWPLGQRIQLATLDESGKPRTIEGPGYSVEPHRIEVRGVDSSTSVPLGEIPAAAWTAILKTRRPIDARTAALLCLLEGDPATAKERLGDSGAGIPDKYWTFSQRVTDAPESPQENEARKLFHSAERQFPQFTATSEAVQKYETLLRGDTAFARRNQPAIAGRIRSGREFLFGFPDLTSGGTFTSSRNAKGEFVWTSEADTEEARANDNFIELAFSVVLDIEYRAWAFVGGCCAETLTFRAEVSDGSTIAPVKQNVATAVRRHATHGGPKQPARWGWVQIPLPKYSSPGPKSIRLCTNQKGFSVAHAIITSLREAPPGESEIKELGKTRERSGNAAMTAGLVGWWTFDEGAGTTIADRTGNGNTGTLHNGASWDVSPTGASVTLDGLDDIITCTAKGLPAANAPQTIAFWFTYDAVPASSQVMVALAKKDFTSGVYSGFHFLAGPTCRIGTWRSAGPFLADASVPPTGKWNHYAYTFDGTRHRLYLNGAGVATSTVAPQTGGPDTLGFGGHAVSNGGSFKGGESFRGKLDDIRIYARTLTAQEAVLLARTRGAAASSK